MRPKPSDIAELDALRAYAKRFTNIDGVLLIDGREPTDDEVTRLKIGLARAELLMGLADRPWLAR